MNTWDIRVRHFAEKHSLDMADICVVGSLPLSLLGIRDNNDIDVVIRDTVRPRIAGSNAACKFGEMIEVVAMGWGGAFGVEDAELLDNPSYHDVVRGIKVARVELIFTHKVVSGRKKDREDVDRIASIIDTLQDWNWGLVRDPVDTYMMHARTLSVRRVLQWLKKKIRRCLRIIVHSIRAVGEKTHQGVGRDVLNNELDVFYSVRKCIGKEYIDGEFNRYDIIVRYLAVERVHEENSDGLALYKKMQERRPSPYQDYLERFRSLIENMKERGYQNDSRIQVSQDGYLIDGAHRLALALYHDVNKIPIEIMHERGNVRDYGIGWFKKNDFSDDEIERIVKKKHDIFTKRGMYFYAIVWPPAIGYYPEIKEEVKAYCDIIESSEYCLSDKEFEAFIHAIYAVDDIPVWKIDRKLYYMKGCEKRIGVILMDFHGPQYRKKASNNHDISRKGEGLKAAIRGKYKSRIPSYVYDICFHTSDNYEHNVAISRILSRQHWPALEKQPHISVESAC